MLPAWARAPAWADQPKRPAIQGLSYATGRRLSRHRPLVESLTATGQPYTDAVPRSEFQRDLDEVEALIQDEARLCRSSLTTVIDALLRRDDDQARQVIASDRGIDSIHIRIESAIESLLATQSPVAVDLRLVISMIHVNLHLERIGDQCVNIAKLSLLMGPASLHRELALDLQTMASQADEMIQVAMRAFGARDLPSAESLVGMDQVINKANYGLARNIVTSVGDAEVGLFVIVIGRCLERVGDNAVDIGERTAYLVSGELREFTDASQDFALE
jgi:phosphate transport system protein